MDGRRVVQRLVNGATALAIARSFGYRSPTPVMDAARDFIAARLGAERYSALADQPGGGWFFNILRKKRLAASRARFAVSRKSRGVPCLSMARYRYRHWPRILMYVSSMRTDPQCGLRKDRLDFGHFWNSTSKIKGLNF